MRNPLMKASGEDEFLLANVELNDTFIHTHNRVDAKFLVHHSTANF